MNFLIDVTWVMPKWERNKLSNCSHFKWPTPYDTKVE